MKRLFTVFLALSLAAAAQAMINLNNADEEALKAIAGISTVIAHNIVEERETNGHFADLADVDKRVKGVGKKQIKALTDAGAVVTAYDDYGAYAANSK